jgi:hypothetical protein
VHRAGFWTRFFSIIKSIRNKIIVLALAVLLGLVALEAFLWGAGIVCSHWPRGGNTVFNKLGATSWGLARNNKYDPICYFLPRGGFFRGPAKTLEGRGFGRIDRPLEKEEDTIRIICIGDSTTQSLTVDYYDSWVYLLGQMLSKQYPGKKIETLNAGIAGGTFKQIKRVFQFYLAKYHSDIVIFRGGNELTDTYFVDTKPDFTRSFVGPILYKSRIFRLFCVLADSSKKADDLQTANKIYDSMTGRNTWPGLLDPSVVGFDSDFSIVKKIAQDHGTKYVLQVDYLTRMSDGRIGSNMTHNNSASLVKTLNAFEEKDTKSPLPANETRVNLVTKRPDSLFIDSCHLTEKGEATLAGEIYKFIVGHKWIEALN